MRRQHSIKRKLSLSFMIYILVFVLFVGLLSNFIIQRQFQEYAVKKQEMHIEEIVSRVNNQFMDNTWIVSNIEVIGKYEIDNGYVISVFDQDKQAIWDAREHNNHRCTEVIENIKNRMKKNNPSWEGTYVTNEFPLYMNQEKIGTVEIGYYDPYFYTNEDFTFLNTLNTVYLLSSIIFIIIAMILGAYMARRLSLPLRKMVVATLNMRKGIYHKLSNDDSGIIEINQLKESINTLISTLEKQELLRKQLTSDVTHELRTPLSTLQAHIEAMQDGIIDLNGETLNSLYDEIIRLNSIVNDLDKLMHYDQEKVELQKTYVDLSQIIHNIILVYQGLFLKENITLEYNSKSAFLYLDQDKIRQVFINLISNALKYTPRGGKIIIDLIEKANEVTIYVKDTGIGIDEKDLPHIFERFYRADQSRNRKTGGAGIGLAIVQSIVQAHNGSIYAESKLNKGTTIIVNLPK